MNQQRVKAAVPMGVLAVAVGYSVWLAGVEVASGQDGLRPYVTDLEGPVALYGLNTTLSAGLLGMAAVLWLASRLVVGQGGSDRVKTFGPLQAAVLMALAVDDRFLVHERLGTMTGLPDPIFLGVVAVGQLGLLLAFRDVAIPTRTSRILVAAAAAAFAMMLGLDALAPETAVLRLAGEEITKVWGAGLLAAWSWRRLGDLAEASRTGMVRHAR